ncbi:hypothetical protein [Dokdonella soli]|uniref:Uncharacterized protein n=1 Tax=Dokdonella soli TaxID=529810 RepID=A0ABN1IP33_9GAMM
MRNPKIYAMALAIAAACGMFTSLLSAQSLEPSTENLQFPANVMPDTVEHEALMATPSASSGSCGVERWSVKTGTDPDAGLVNLNSPVIQTISYLRSQPAPATLPANSRVQPTESTLFVIDATLTEYKLENDSDYHLVVRDASGNTMITEIPDPACVGTGSPFASYITTARQQFDAKYTTTTSFQTANIPVQITGVGFFDFQHGQTGVAPNGIELHPILDIRFNPGSGTPDFALSAAPASVSVTQGSNGTSTLTVTPSGGFTGSVNLSASGLPSGVTAAFSPASTTGTSTLTLTAAATATTGPATVTVTGVSGSLSHTTTINLTVVASGGGGGGQTAVYNAALKVPECATTGSSCDSGPTLLLGRGTMSGGVEPNQPNTINNSCADGTSGTFHSDESNDRIAIASTDGGPLTAGKTAKVTATVWAYDSTSDALDLYSAADANNPTWVFLNTITPSAAGAQALSTTFTLPSGGLQAVRAHFRYQGSASSCSTGSYDESDDLVFAVAAGTPTPDFSVAASPSSLSVNQGASGTSTLTVGSLNGFSAATTFSVSGLPTGVTASFSTNPVTPASGGNATSTLTLAASSTATVGAATVTVTATSGSISHTATVGLTVNAVTRPDYSLSASPASVSATQGGSTSSTISVAPVGGFSGSVNLSASGLPSGVTAAFNPAITAGTSVLTLTAGAAATTGPATVTVTGTSGSLSHTTTISLTVNATTPPDYSLSASPASVSVTQGASGNSTISVAPVGGFSGSVSLSASGLPSGVTAAFSPANTTGTSTLTLTASSTATTGTATVTVTGTSGTLSHTATISLTVNAGGGTPQQLFGNTGFESGVATPWSISSGALCSNSSCSGETAHTGTWFAWLDGYGSAHTDTLSQQVALPAGKTTATLAFWLHIDTAETSTTTAYDKLTVQVLNSSGTVLKTLATYSNLNANTGYAQRTLDVSTYIGQTVTIKFTGTEDSQLQTSFVLDDLTLTVQ